MLLAFPVLVQASAITVSSGQLVNHRKSVLLTAGWLEIQDQLLLYLVSGKDLVSGS